MEKVEISILILTYNEEGNLTILLPQIHNILKSINKPFEIIIIDGESTDNTVKVATELGAKVYIQKKSGYGEALKEGINYATGKYIINLDADLSHDPYIIKNLYDKKDEAEVIIASRYVLHGFADMSLSRKILSNILNRFFQFFLSLPYKDLSTSYRLYHKKVFRDLKLEGKYFDVLIELLIRLHCAGYKIIEIPFHYRPRKKGVSKTKLIKFGKAYMKTFYKMWKLRSLPTSADYDERAFYSRIPLQRWWQRKRYKFVMENTKNSPFILDIGCGTSNIIQGLHHAVALDININKLRYLRYSNRPLVLADLKKLPFKKEIFDEVICLEVIEHVPYDIEIFKEMYRVLKKDGLLMIGTPDYSKITWRIIERIYSILFKEGWAKEHICHYTYDRLRHILEETGFRFIKSSYIANAEMNFVFRK